MGSIWSTRVAVAAMALALLPAGAATAMTDYSKNGATGTYATAIVHKNYALNGATGDFAPPTDVTQPSVRVARVTHDGGFAWGLAAVGAGVSLLVLLAIGATSRRIRRRQVPVRSPARPGTV
jgi:hypothetical protein